MTTMNEFAAIINGRLETIICAPDNTVRDKEGDVPSLLRESMRYSLLAGGKRLRPSMFLAALEMFGADYTEWVDFACSIEMIHSYSLIHDDLPGMDDDTLRRGKPTNHVVFGVGQAILAGDGLLNNAFETMLRTAIANGKNADRALKAVYEIATGCGVTGMIAGQVADLYSERNRIADPGTLSFIQLGKTACMFIYPLRAAARLAGTSDEELNAIAAYGEAFGRMFQAADDLLDVVGDSASMGKTLGKDAEAGKLTMVSQYGIDETRRIIEKLHGEALRSLESIPRDTSFFEQLVDSMLGRTV